MHRIIIDGDPGHDDILAFLTALAHPQEIEILAYSTVVGNATVENCSRNALKVQDYFGVEIPVAQGYDQPLTRPLHLAYQFHGQTGLDGAPFLKESRRSVEKKHAVEYLKDVLENSEEKVEIVSMGPLTNIAMLIKTYPEVLDKIERLVMMGGCFSLGNALPKSEFNIYHDPEAAKIVFDSPLKISMAGIEACFAGAILLKDIEELKAEGKGTRLLKSILDFYSQYAYKNNWDRIPIFDVTPIMYLLKPEIFKVKQYHVEVEIKGEVTLGMTVCDERGPVYLPEVINPREVLLDCDREQFSRTFFESFRILDERYE
ncbi:MAG: nucleoside hydrolase [Erysipelotrichaceae bacterium]|nr:nucleoside hydrolase [Erysipelotrichaceae bacterium]